MKIRRFEVERDEEAGWNVLVTGHVDTMEQALSVAARLQDGVAEVVVVRPSQGEQETVEVAQAASDLARAAGEGTIPLAQPMTRPVPEGEEKPVYKVPAVGEPPRTEVKKAAPKGGSGASSPAKATPSEGKATTPLTAGAAGASKSATAPTTPPSEAGEDYAAFNNHTRLGEVVEEVRKRGHNTFDSILAYCRKLQDIGDVSPPLDELGARLEERLKVHLAGKGVQVP